MSEYTPQLRACPVCESSDYLHSVETITVEYPITITAAESGDDLDYTGGDRLTFDDSAEFTDEIHCRGCDWEGTIADLTDPRETQS